MRLCACVRACVRLFVCVHMCIHARVGVHAHKYARMHARTLLSLSLSLVSLSLSVCPSLARSFSPRHAELLRQTAAVRRASEHHSSHPRCQRPLSSPGTSPLPPLSRHAARLHAIRRISPGVPAVCSQHTAARHGGPGGVLVWSTATAGVSPVPRSPPPWLSPPALLPSTPHLHT